MTSLNRALGAGVHTEEKFHEFSSAYDVSKRLIDIFGAIMATLLLFPS